MKEKIQKLVYDIKITDGEFNNYIFKNHQPTLQERIRKLISDSDDKDISDLLPRIYFIYEYLSFAFQLNEKIKKEPLIHTLESLMNDI